MNKPICPFCNHATRYDMVGDNDHKAYRCDCRHCQVNPYSKFMITYDAEGKLWSYDLIIDQYVIHGQMDPLPYTCLYKVSKVDFKMIVPDKIEMEDIIYHRTTLVIRVNRKLLFDVNHSIESAQQIKEKLLKLNIFS